MSLTVRTKHEPTTQNVKTEKYSALKLHCMKRQCGKVTSTVFQSAKKKARRRDEIGHKCREISSQNKKKPQARTVRVQQ